MRLPLTATFAALLMMSTPAMTADITGRASVVDGDTITIEGTGERVRLYGIDAPESGQTCNDANGKRYRCGGRSADYLAQLIGRNGRVRCVEIDRDRYGRSVSECFRGDVNLNAEMIRAGWAVEYVKYSDGRYPDAEVEARSARRGMWQGEFMAPWEWRHAQRPAPQVAADPQCQIKGNVSKSGNKIFHRPGQADYDRVVITESKGERWFCTEDDAKAAGWRPEAR